jgi:Abnormal spindle-like microcephaly-assoc'd, ASPM-SPD-2-Hydin
VDASGNAHVSGLTGSSDFPTTPGAFQMTFGGVSDAFVTKLSFPPAPALALSPSSLAFGPQAVGTASAAQQVRLTNAGTETLDIVSIVASGDFTQTNDCPGTVVPRGFCTLSVTFTPAGAGARTGAVTITDNAGSPRQLPLTGTGGIPAVSLSPGSLTFASQTVGTTSPAQPATLKNMGNRPLSITSIATAGDFAQTNTCGSTVNPGTSCTLNVTFTPTAAGARTGAISITDDASGSPDQLPLSGTGVGVPGVSLRPASAPFLVLRTVGTTSPTQTVKLTNVGSGQLDITGITVTGPDAGDFAQSNNCPPTVASGASCLITVTFTPTAQGLRTASVSIADNAPGSPQTVPLTGRGTSFQWSPRSLNMGDQPVGTSSGARTVKLTNAGTAPITLFSIEIGGVNPGDFAQTNTCGGSLNPGASCTIQVTFTPTAVGGRLGHVAIRDSAFGGTHVVGLLGKGT